MAKLTVAITSYNYAQYLPTAIMSAINQEYDDFEVLIIDDGSTDESPQIIQNYANLYPQIRTHLRKENRGVVATLNEAIDLARGAYLHILSADDRCLPGFFKKSMELLLKHPEIGICCSNFTSFEDEEHGKLQEKPLISNQLEAVVFKAEEIIPIFEKTPFWIPGHTSIYKREELIKYGKLDPELGYKCDFILLHSIAFNTGVAYIPEPLAAMRLHAHSFSHQGRKLQKRKIHKKILSKLRKQPQLYDQFRRSSLLYFILMDRFWIRFFNPRYLTFWRYINTRSPIKERMARSFRRHFRLKREHSNSL